MRTWGTGEGQGSENGDQPSLREALPGPMVDVRVGDQMPGMRGGRPRWLSRPRGVWPSSRVKGPGHVGRAGGARAGAGWRGAVHFTVYPAGVAPHTEAVFPSSSCSCKVIMNISFMFSHIYYSYAQTPDEMPRLSYSAQPPGRGCVSSPGSVCASVGGPGRPARTRTKRGLAPRTRSLPVL